MPTSLRTYPQPGTMAERILGYIRVNPGASPSGIHRKLVLNPSPARDCIRKLLDKGLIEDRQEGSVHHYYARETTPKL